MDKFVSLAVFLVLVAAAALTGMNFLPGDWYAALNKPSFTPPNWVFQIAWTILYVMIAIAGWLAWRAEDLSAATIVWGVGLMFNAFWSYLMFGRHDIGLALVDLIALWLAIAVFVRLTRRAVPLASYLFFPYLGWVTFAGVLNFELWRLN